MKILVVNAGSSSLKYQLIDMDSETVMAKGICERVAIDGSRLKHQAYDGEKIVIEQEMPNHSAAFRLVIDTLLSKENGVIADVSEISAIGHRIVHGGEHFSGSVLITEEVKAAITECVPLAPLHNPAHLMGISACEEVMPGVPQVAVFDTAFHQTMDKTVYLYGLPIELYEKYKIRKYGFHGTSHKFVATRAAELMGKPLEELKIVTCHLGNGSSITAVDHGKSVDTSMGFTPLDGLIMASRSGSIDPAIVPFVMKHENLSSDEMDALLNKKSGVLGMTGYADFRDLEFGGKDGDPKAQLGLDRFDLDIVRTVGAYIAEMGGCDAIVFTAGVGENFPEMRANVIRHFACMGFVMDESKNNVRGKEVDLTAPGSVGKIFIIPTNEELAIAQETQKIVSE